MKKVLFITYFYPPLGGAGVHRSLKFSKYLPEFGWQPVVIGADQSVNCMKDPTLLAEIPETVRVFRVKPTSPGLMDLGWRVAKRLKLAFDFPDIYRNWYGPAYRLARKLLQDEKPAVIYTSSLPYTSHLIGLRLKEESGLPWVADFRDPWSGNKFEWNIHASRLRPPLNHLREIMVRRAERRIVCLADRVITACPTHQGNLSELYPAHRDKLAVITNGFDERDFPTPGSVPPQPGKPRIIYLGEFYFGYREIAEKFLRILLRVHSDFELIFVGSSAQEMREVRDPRITCLPAQPKREALALAQNADFLLMIMPFGSHIPGKAYEYLYLQKPILALVDPDGDAARIIRHAGTGFVLPLKPKGMEEGLRAVFQGWQKGKLQNLRTDDFYLAQFSRRNLTRKLADFLNEVEARPRPGEKTGGGRKD